MQIVNITPPTTRIPPDSISMGTFDIEEFCVFTFFMVPILKTNLRKQIDIKVVINILKKHGKVQISVTEETHNV